MLKRYLVDYLVFSFFMFLWFLFSPIACHVSVYTYIDGYAQTTSTNANSTLFIFSLLSIAISKLRWFSALCFLLCWITYLLQSYCTFFCQCITLKVCRIIGNRILFPFLVVSNLRMRKSKMKDGITSNSSCLFVCVHFDFIESENFRNNLQR